MRNATLHPTTDRGRLFPLRLFTDRRTAGWCCSRSISQTRLLHIVLFVIMALVAPCERAEAAIIDHGTYITDTSSGLDWLKVNQTIGMSYNSVSSQLGTGGQFQGWSYAQIILIQQLIQNAGGSIPMTGWSSANNGVVATLLNNWGTTQAFPEARIITGTFFGPNLGVSILSDDPGQSNSITQDFISLSETTIAPQSSNAIYGSALYRVTPTIVPEPSGGLLLAGMAVCFQMVRRKRTDR